MKGSRTRRHNLLYLVGALLTILVTLLTVQAQSALPSASADTSVQTGYVQNQEPWTNIGPIPTSNCTSTSTPPYPLCISSSGQVGALAIAPATQSSPETIYQATSGGLWKSTNNGTSWTDTTVGYSYSVGAVSVSPVDPNEVFAGAGNSLLWSINAGQSWTRISSNASVLQIVASPTNPHVFYYVQVPSHIDEATYNGTTWSFQQILNNGRWIALDPQNPDVMYVSTGSVIANQQNGILEGTYSGTKWAFSLTDPTWWASTASSYASVSRVTVSTVNPNDIYVLLYTQNGVHAYLCYSTDAGTTWGCDSGMASAEGPDSGTSTIFAHALAASTTSASTVAVGWGGGTNIWLNVSSGSPTMETFTSDLYGGPGSSTDAGNDFATYSLAYDANGNLFVGAHGVTELTSGGVLNFINNSALSTQLTYPPIAERNSGALIEEGAQGLSNDQYVQGTGWERTRECYDNQLGTALDPFNQKAGFCATCAVPYISGFDITNLDDLNDSLNQVKLTLPTSVTTPALRCFSGGDIAIGGTSTTPEMFLATGQHLYELAHPISTGIAYYNHTLSTVPWVTVPTGIGQSQESNITWVSINQTNPQIMFVGSQGAFAGAAGQNGQTGQVSSGSVAMSTDGGATWKTILTIPFTQAIANEGGQYTTVKEIWQSPNLNTDGLPSVILVSCNYGSSGNNGTPCLYESTDGGQTWSDIAATLPSTAYATSLPTLGDPGFTDQAPPLSASLPITYTTLQNDISSACYDPIGHAVYAATSAGVYFTQSVNGSYTTWARAGAGMGPAAVDQVLCTQEGKIIAATHGQGIWELNGVSSPYGSVPSLAPVAPQPLSARTLNITGSGFIPPYGYTRARQWPSPAWQWNETPNTSIQSAPEPTAVWLNGVPLYDPTITPITLSVSVSPASIQAGTNTLVVATPGGMATTTFQGTLPVPLPQSNYVPVSPHRIVDTRCSEASQPTFCPSENLPSVNASLGMVTPTHPITVSVAGSASGLVPLSATAVVLNVTAIDASSNSGYVTVSPTTTSSVSSLNVSPGHASFNLVTSKLSSTGTVQISSSVDVNIAGDIEGYYTSESGMDFTGIAPIRLVDTRCASTPQPDYCASENLPQANASLSAIPPGGTIQVHTGSGGAGAMAVNVTVPDAKSGGYLTLYSGSSKPVTSNVNFSKEGTVANVAIVPLSTQESFYIYNSSNQPENVIVDEMGTFSQAGTETYSPISPLRICDTRKGTDVISGITGQCDNSGELLAANSSMSVGGIETALINAAGSTASASTLAAPVAVVMNVTAVNPTSSGYLTVYPSSSARPTTSSVNFTAGTIQASQVVVDVGSGGSFSIYSSSNVNVVVDVEGFYW